MRAPLSPRRKSPSNPRHSLGRSPVPERRTLVATVALSAHLEPAAPSDGLRAGHDRPSLHWRPEHPVPWGYGVNRVAQHRLPGEPPIRLGLVVCLEALLAVGINAGAESSGTVRITQDTVTDALGCDSAPAQQFSIWLSRFDTGYQSLLEHKLASDSEPAEHLRMGVSVPGNVCCRAFVA
jgi:hypothetical protein